MNSIGAQGNGFLYRIEVSDAVKAMKVLLDEKIIVLHFGATNKFISFCPPLLISDHEILECLRKFECLKV